MWSLRGVLDSLVGGVGMRRGRLHPHHLSVGDPLDFWRVESLVPDGLLAGCAPRCCCPATPGCSGRSPATATAPPSRRRHGSTRAGLLGRAYWIAVAPFHRFVFPGLLAGICGDAERLHAFVGSAAPSPAQ